MKRLSEPCLLPAVPMYETTRTLHIYETASSGGMRTHLLAKHAVSWTLFDLRGLFEHINLFS